MTLYTSGVCDVTKESIQWILTKQGKGNAAIIVVGGAEEALEARPGNYNLKLKNRKGFIKMAIKNGCVYEKCIMYQLLMYIFE